MEQMNARERYYAALRHLERTMQTYYDAHVLGIGDKEGVGEALVAAQSAVFIAWKRMAKENE